MAASGSGGFSAALCRGLIEAWCPDMATEAPRRFPRLYAAASLKQAVRLAEPAVLLRFPRLYAAASLKR